MIAFVARGPFVTALMTLMLLAVGCGTDDPFARPDAVVGIRANGCGLETTIGTGVIISTDQGPRLVTSAHTVAGMTDVQMVGADADHPATLLHLDPAADIAVLDSAGVDHRGLDLAPVRTGELTTLFTWHPDEGPGNVVTRVSRLLDVTIEDIYLDSIIERSALEVPVPTRSGHSGSPLITNQGAVTGIVYATSREREASFLVDAREISGVLADAHTSPSPIGRCR